jgi:predicted ABC-type ATPase
MKVIDSKEIWVFAGPNGSGKSSTYNLYYGLGIPDNYITPDNIVAVDDRDNKQKYIEAMIKAEELRNEAVQRGVSFTFETVFSRGDKLQFLKDAHKVGYHITVIYITTSDYNINIRRVEQRIKSGGHNVPKDKIISRYEKSMRLLPDIIDVADVIKVYDNSTKSILVFEKTHDSKVILHNREQRHKWVDHYITEPLKAKGQTNIIDYGCIETQKYLKRRP